MDSNPDSDLHESYGFKESDSHESGLGRIRNITIFASPKGVQVRGRYPLLSATLSQGFLPLGSDLVRMLGGFCLV